MPEEAEGSTREVGWASISMFLHTGQCVLIKNLAFSRACGARPEDRIFLLGAEIAEFRVASASESGIPRPHKPVSVARCEEGCSLKNPEG